MVADQKKKKVIIHIVKRRQPFCKAPLSLRNCISKFNLGNDRKQINKWAKAYFKLPTQSLRETLLHGQSRWSNYSKKENSIVCGLLTVNVCAVWQTQLRVFSKGVNYTHLDLALKKQGSVWRESGIRLRSTRAIIATQGWNFLRHWPE